MADIDELRGPTIHGRATIEKRNMKNMDSSYKGHNLIFLVGCPRSGTTWLQRLLASHSAIRTGQESHLFDWYVRPQLHAWRRSMRSGTAAQRGGVGLACYYEEQEFKSILRNYIVDLLKPMVSNLESGEWFLEKSPSHALSLSEIQEFLPASRIIHILRDPRDVVSSLLAASKSWGSRWAANTPRRAARIWVEYVEAVASAATRIPPDQFREVRYEELSENPTGVLKGLYEFLGVRWTCTEIDQAIHANEAGRVKAGGGTEIPLNGYLKRISGVSATEPPGFVRKARPGAWVNDLTLTQKAVVWHVARKTMRDVGYLWNFRDSI